ncbi:hypothetical protein MKW92_012587 [Papaver armeniacum]|nr:hypothetical protein MKW92_012587 [Papaver armeniacum]
MDFGIDITNVRVNHRVQFGEVKNPGEAIPIWNGTLNGKPVTIVLSNRDQIFHEQHLINVYHILKHVMDAEGGRCKLFEPYICTLEELILLKEGKLDYGQLPCTPEERQMLEGFRFLDANNRPTPEGLNFIRDIIEGTYELYSNGIIHGDLTAKNIVVCPGNESGKLIAKLTRIQNNVFSGDDYYSLGEVVGACFSFLDNMALKLPPEVDEFQNCVWKMRRPTNKGLVNQEWTALTKSMEVRFITDPRILFRHPLFWNADMCITFMIQYRMLMSRCDNVKWANRKVKQFTDAVDKVLTPGWFNELPDFVRAEVTQNRTTDETQYLLRFIRNIYCHFETKSEAFIEEVGTPPDQLFEYFRVKFPTMLLDTHRVLQYYFPVVKQETDFSYSFEKYI